jgi:hypothetical protein
MYMCQLDPKREDYLLNKLEVLLNELGLPDSEIRYALRSAKDSKVVDVEQTLAEHKVTF